MRLRVILFVGALLAGFPSSGLRADEVFERRALSNGFWRVAGGARRTRYVQFTVGEGGATLRHNGAVVDFTRGGPWTEEGGKPVMVCEAGPVEVEDGDLFRVSPNADCRRLVLAERPLAFAPQKLYTPDAVCSPEPYAVQGTFSEKALAFTVENLAAAAATGCVRAVMTDYWQREVGRFERTGVALSGKTAFEMPFSDTRTGYFVARISVTDAAGRAFARDLVHLSDVRTAHRETVRMNAGWERTFVQDDGTPATRTIRPDPPAKAVWRRVAFPAENKGALSWFRCEREIPASFAGRRVFFRVQRLCGDAALYVDGACAAVFGRDFNFDGAQEADVTAFLKPGARQAFLLVSRPTDICSYPPEELARRNLDPRKALAFPGRRGCGELALEARGAAHLGDVRVETSFRRKTIRVTAAHPAGYAVRNAVYRGDERLLAFGESAAWADPVLWGPFEFPLLRLVTELVDADGRVVDEKETRFGFREIWADGLALMWNGHRVKGDARSFVSTWGWNFDARCKRQHNADILRAAKSRGVKFLRHVYNSSEFLDYCDELGLLVAKGGLTIAGPSPEKSAAARKWAAKERSDRAMIETHFNHPSVMTWYLTNEYFAFSDDRNFAPVASAVRAATALDPTRFVEAGCDLDLRGESAVVSTHYPVEFHAFRDAGCFMPYCFYWRPVDRPFTVGAKVPFGQVESVCNVFEKRPITWGEKPICINETGWDYFFQPPFGFTRIAGDDVFQQVNFVQKWHVETGVELVRGHRDADATLWTFWRWFTSDPVWRVSPEIDVVNIQRYTRFYAGEPVAYDVNAFCDAWKRHDALVWFWRLEDASGKAVAEGPDAVRPVGTSALFRERIAFSAPAPGAYTLRFGFRGRCERALPVVVSARPAASGPWPNVIPAEAALTTNLLARAAAGETIVLLAREDYPDWLPETARVTEQSAAILRTFRPGHPLLAGVSEADLRYFYPKSIACRHAFAKPAAGNARTVVEFGGPSGLNFAALLEVPYGKGCFLYSRLVLEPEANPVAAKLLDNMANYRRRTPPGTALLLEGAGEALEKALRVRCGVAYEVGGLSRAAEHAAVLVDGGRPFTDREIDALRTCGRQVLVFNPGPSFGLSTRPVRAASWKGRAVRLAADPLTEGLTNQDLMWRTKFEDPRTAAADLGPAEFAAEEGALFYPVYAVRQGNLVFLQADPGVHAPSVDPSVRRFWSTLFANAGVRVTPFEKPSVPKGLVYTPLDLTPLLDRTLDDAQADDGVGSWNDQGAAQTLPMKFRHPTAWLGMVPYDVKRQGPCAFALQTECRRGGRSNVVVAVNGKADTVNWLWSSVWTTRGRLHYRMRLRYADGTSASLDGRGGVNVADCYAPSPDFGEETDSVTVFRQFPTTNKVFRLANVYATTFVNPHPERPIASVEFERGEARCARVGIFAVTLGSRAGACAHLPAAARAARHDRLVSEALAAQKAGRPEAAVAAYEEALRVRPEALGVYRSIAAIYEGMGDWEAALTTYRRSLEADFNQPDVWEAEKRVKAKLARAGCAP